MSWRKVYEDERFIVGLRYDLGHWTIESREKKNGRTTSVTVTPAAMDALVAGWPSFKARDVGDVTRNEQ